MCLKKTHKKILITGANGQLGCALKEEQYKYPNHTYVFTTKEILDITSEISIKDNIERHQPDIIINTAAYTAVDAAETYQSEAYLLNETSVGVLAKLCAEYAIALIHISTDYVFDGLTDTPYTENVLPNPQTVYGKSKFAGEKAIQNVTNLNYIIIRTSWLYSNYGHNFYKTMLRIGKEREEISIVNDQYGIPTLANDLAIAILEITTKLDASHTGIYHYSNKEVTTWYAFAKAIFEYSKLDIKIRPVTSDKYPTAAKRPKYSILDCENITETFGVHRPLWQKSLRQII